MPEPRRVPRVNQQRTNAADRVVRRRQANLIGKVQNVVDQATAVVDENRSVIGGE